MILRPLTHRAANTLNTNSIPVINISATDAATKSNDVHLMHEFNKLKKAGTVGLIYHGIFDIRPSVRDSEGRPWTLTETFSLFDFLALTLLFSCPFSTDASLHLCSSCF